MLFGRRTECAMLDTSLKAMREGHSNVLMLLGDAGIGKTALLDYALQAGADAQILRVSGVEAEMELPYAGVHQLCLPLVEGIGRLPAPQAHALGLTFGLVAGERPGPFLVGLGLLNLLAEAARERPLLCVVDDAHWLDDASAQAFAFVARRLRVESVFLLVASRAPLPSMRGLPEFTVEGLAAGAARELLDSVVRWPLDNSVRTAILAEARGNPLALLELPLASPDRLAGGFGLLDASGLSGRIEDSFRHRIDGLPAESRDLLLLASADSTGDPVLLWRAGALLGLSPKAGGPVQEANLLTIGVRVAFRHPLVRSAVYRSATPADRRRAHRALADATSRESDPDRRAWHLAHAAPAPDEEIAGELESSADRAQARGGLAAAAAFLDRAATLTADPEARAERELAAARNRYHAGAPDGARALLDRAESGPPDPLRSAHIAQLRAHLAFAAGDVQAVPALFVDAARQFEHLDPVLARNAYLDGITYGVLVGRFAGRATAADVAAAAAAAPDPGPVPRPQDLLLDALAVLYRDGHAKGTPNVRLAVEALCRDEIPVAEATRWLGIGCHAAYEIWDDTAWDVLSELNLRHTRAAGALVTLPMAMNQRIFAHLHAGRLRAAAGLLEESAAVIEATGIGRPGYDAPGVAVWRGQEAKARSLLWPAITTATERSEGIGLSVLHHTHAVLCNSLGRFAEAREAAQAATVVDAETSFASWAAAELVEAAVRCGHPDQAARAVERLARTTTPSGTDWGLGMEARSRALISAGREAEELYAEAIDRLGRSRGVVALARTHLVYGEWLRRHDREADARRQLSTAHSIFADIGADGFARRARAELEACGVDMPVRVLPQVVELTEQERRIAQRARDGRSNAEIGTELCLSARTVEWHLRKVFTKLGISSRRELGTVLR